MFSQKSFTAALLAICTSAQDFSPSTKEYPLFAAAIAGENPNLTWEAYEITTDSGYIKTLFHITGMTGYDEYYPHYQPLLIANGAGTNSMSYLYDESAFTIMTGVDLATIQGSWVAEYQAGTVPKSIDDMLRREYSDCYKALTPLLVDTEGNALDLTTLVDSEAFLANEECETARYTDMADILQILMKGGTYAELSDSIPVAFWNEGYDIWIQGNKGTVYQDGHTDPDISPADYWDFSYYDMGTEDIVAEIEYILAITGQESLSFIGYSMSTAAMLYAAGIQDEER